VQQERWNSISWGAVEGQLDHDSDSGIIGRSRIDRPRKRAHNPAVKCVSLKGQRAVTLIWSTGRTKGVRDVGPRTYSKHTVQLDKRQRNKEADCSIPTKYETPSREMNGYV
jgi:hypothetical protein